MFKPINEFNDCNIKIKNSLSILSNLKLKYLDIILKLEQAQKLEHAQKLEETQKYQLSLIQTFSLIQTLSDSFLHILIQDLLRKKNSLYKKIVEEEKKILEYEIRKNDYIIFINSYINTNSEKELKLVPAKYPNKDI
jgi:hypothetical protein